MPVPSPLLSFLAWTGHRTLCCRRSDWWNPRGQPPRGKQVSHAWPLVCSPSNSPTMPPVPMRLLEAVPRHLTQSRILPLPPPSPPIFFLCCVQPAGLCGVWAPGGRICVQGRGRHGHLFSRLSNARHLPFFPILVVCLVVCLVRSARVHAGGGRTAQHRERLLGHPPRQGLRCHRVS